MQDTISSELRAVESEIDGEHAKNPLFKTSFSQAAWHFLAVCEEYSLRHILQEDGLDVEYAAIADNLINHAREPFSWFTADCFQGQPISPVFDDALYSAALELSDHALMYGSFSAAFTYASWGLLTLELDGNTIRSSGPIRGDVRFEAYDRLLRNKTESSIAASIDMSFAQQVTESVRVTEESFTYPLSPKIVQAGIAALSPTIDSRFRLPGEWIFPNFTLDEFRQVARVLWVLSFIHFQSRVVAAQSGCRGLGITRAVLLMSREEILQRVRRYTGLRVQTVSAILDALTYGEKQLNPDPALQPLVPLSTLITAVSPTIVLNSSMERNFAVLLNRLPQEREVYARLSQGKEKALREQLMESLSGLGFRFWFGQISEWGAASEIDLVIISDDEQQCLVLELKAFTGPAEPREIRDRSSEIEKGIKQIEARKSAASKLPTPLLARLSVDHTYAFSWAVASETSIGAPYVQSTDVPVVNADHLKSRLLRDRALKGICLWLETRAYLPIEGVHFKSVSVERSIGKWTLDWYGIEPLTDEFISQ